MLETNHSPHKHELLFDSLVELLNTTSFDKISIQELCQLAGVSRMYYYRHYNNLEEIIRKKLDVLFADYCHEVASIQEKDKLTTALLFFKTFRPFHRELLILWRADLGYLIKHAFKEYLDTMAKEGILEAIKPTMYRYWQSYVASGLYEVLMTWVQSGIKESDYEMAQTVYHITRNFVHILA